MSGPWLYPGQDEPARNGQPPYTRPYGSPAYPPPGYGAEPPAYGAEPPAYSPGYGPAYPPGLVAYGPAGLQQPADRWPLPAPQHRVRTGAWGLAVAAIVLVVIVVTATVVLLSRSQSGSASPTSPPPVVSVSTRTSATAVAVRPMPPPTGVFNPTAGTDTPTTSTPSTSATTGDADDPTSGSSASAAATRAVTAWAAAVNDKRATDAQALTCELTRPRITTAFVTLINSSVRVATITTTGSTGTASFSYQKTTDTSRKTDVLHLVTEDGSWKVCQ